MAMADPAAGLHAQLDKLAIQFALPGRLPDVDQAISLACELITRDLVTPATVDVAALGYGTALRVGDELGLVQPANDERAESRLTRCIGMGDIRAADRPGEAIIGVVVSGLAPRDVRAGGVLRGAPGKP
jgi:hypothetical protein